MKNKKGFTLIELLAVIVILAIIALIAVPVILNIIDKANKSALKDTAYGVISAGELYFAEQQLELNGMSEDKTFNLPEDANTENGIQLKGNIPTGIVKVTTEGKVSIAVQNGRYCITKGYKDKDVTISEDIDNCHIPSSSTENTLIDVMNTTTNDCVKSGQCTESEIVAGIKVNINVNDEQTYDFYVIGDTGSKVTLIMDRNLGNNIDWYDVPYNMSDDDTTALGPITALNYLNELTDDEWSNIPAITSYEYKNNPDASGTAKEYGYQKLVITNGTGVLTSKDGNITTTLSGTSRARLITYEEVLDLEKANSDDLPSWLYIKVDGIYGYWSITSKEGLGPGAVAVDVGFGWCVAMVNDASGIRPVIELSK